MMILFSFLLLRVVHTQNDWVGGSSVLGPVTNWGTSFYYVSDSLTYTTQGEIHPLKGQINYSNWVSHTIETNANIGCHSIWPADFDGDGDIDLAGWIGKANQLAFYRNDNGVFTKMNTYATVAASDWGFLSGADFNGDGRQDVVVPAGFSNTFTHQKGVKWYRNDGNFNFTPISIEPSSGTTSYARIDCQCDDIDNDGDVDLIVGTVYPWLGQPGEFLRIYKNNGSGTFSLFDSVAGNYWRSKLVDLNGDGYKDLMVGDPMTPRGIVIYFNNGTGKFNQVTSLVNGVDSIDGLGSRDFDNDGDQDITACSNRAYWFENNGTGTTYTRHTIYAGSAAEFADGACSEDMDLDGKYDLVAGFTKLAWFRQIGPDNFTAYVLDDYSSISSSTHWVVPIKIKSGCIGGGWDIVVCRQGAFMWYANNMVSGFATGWLESSVLETASQQRSFMFFGWEACLPQPNTIAFYWRGDNVASNITSKAWEGPFYAAQEIDSIALPTSPCYRFFQYKAQLLKATVVDAPVLYKVWLSDTNCLGGGIAENPITLQTELKTIGNKVLLSVNKPIEKATLSVFNIAGELVQTIYNGKLEAKTYKFSPNLPTKGIYLVVLKSNTCTKTVKLINTESSK
ncbi:MAG: T9SS type A sorting domain-containing protein [bacterium]|nr:T9SS type A sorting domain-containing protein [bacterium]